MKTPEQTLSDLLALGEKLTPGPWLRDESDTNPGRPAVFADGGITGVAQVAIFPREFTAATENADFLADAKNALPALREYMEEVKGLRRVLLRVIEAAERALGDHEAPGDCFATGPLTGNAFADLVSCPGCVQINEIAEARAALSRLGGK